MKFSAIIYACFIICSNILFAQQGPVSLKELSRVRIAFDNSDTTYGAFGIRANRFVKKGNYLYTVMPSGGLKIVDVSDSLRPKVAGFKRIDGFPKSIALSAGYVFIADIKNGLIIVDVSDVQNPKILSTVLIPEASALDVRGDYVFVLNDKNEFFAVNCTDKYLPVVEFSQLISTSKYHDKGQFKNIRVSGDNIWMDFYDDSLYCFTYSAKKLNRVFSIKPNQTSWPEEIKIWGNYLFISDISAWIFDLSKMSFISKTTSRIPSTVISAAYNDKIKTLFTMEIVDWGVSIQSYGLTDPANPKSNPYGFGLDRPENEILTDNGVLYLLTTTEIVLYSVTKTTDISERDENGSLVKSFFLAQNYPNPFNPITTIVYSLPTQSFVELKVYDMLGREVSTLVNEQKPAGDHKLQLDASSLPSGVYIYTLQAGSYRDSKKLLLLK